MSANFHDVYGMRVFINPMLDNVPRMTVSPRFAELMPADFVADLNAWMLDFFGTRNEIFKLADGSVVMGPKTFQAVKEAM